MFKDEEYLRGWIVGLDPSTQPVGEAEMEGNNFRRFG